MKGSVTVLPRSKLLPRPAVACRFAILECIAYAYVSGAELKKSLQCLSVQTVSRLLAWGGSLGWGNCSRNSHSHESLAMLRPPGSGLAASASWRLSVLGDSRTIEHLGGRMTKQRAGDAARMRGARAPSFRGQRFKRLCRPVRQPGTAGSTAALTAGQTTSALVVPAPAWFADARPSPTKKGTDSPRWMSLPVYSSM